ncbi:uncharacterized protein Dwil_GK19641 [Drosophila willistoni]|uniref:Uncharacterized protein n=1 Tax=Drosophila willistoni TaxID=7260 RepID=B4MNT7_DROWI|nr:uncharacterized protein Dwil_GK19641 [Drosophila willistoni]
MWQKTLDFWCQFFNEDPQSVSPPPQSFQERPAKSALSNRIKRRRGHIKFSPSTLQRIVNQKFENLSSTNEFFNFVLKEQSNRMGLKGLGYCDLVRGKQLSEIWLIWERMDEEKRAPYLALAERVHRRQLGLFQNQRKMDEIGYKMRENLLLNHNHVDNEGATRW